MWWAGFAVVVVLETVLSELPFGPPTWVPLISAVVFAATMGVLMASSLNADTRTVFNAARREAQPTDWRRVRAVVPLVLGTFACYLAAIVYARFLDTDTIRALPAEIAGQVSALPLPERLAALAVVCENAINPGYFQHVVAVIPLLMLTLGVEFNYFSNNLLDPAHRATTAATVAVMSAALLIALSTLSFDGVGCGGEQSGWHEFLAFVVSHSAQGIFTGLATLVWMLVASTPDGR